MKLLIIGATSFIGPSVLEKILQVFSKEEDIISCLVRAGTDEEKLSKLKGLALSYNRKINFTVGNLLNSDSIHNSIGGAGHPNRSDGAYRADCPDSADRSARPDCSDSTDCPDCLVYLVDLRNTTFIKNLLSSVSKTGIKRAVFVSSTSVLVPFESEAKKAKLQSENLIQDFGRRFIFDYTILRPTMIYGSPDDRNYSKMLNFIKKRGFFVMFGNGENLIRPVFIEDAASAVAAVIRNNKTFNKIYTLCGKEPITYKDMLLTVKSLVKKPFKIIRLPLLASKFFVAVYSKIFPKSNLKPDMIERMQVDKTYSYEAAQKDFGFSPILFRQGIEVLIRKMDL
jgi:nucleoside-diphosphate-sugar epimerase